MKILKIKLSTMATHKNKMINLVMAVYKIY